LGNLPDSESEESHEANDNLEESNEISDEIKKQLKEKH